MPPEPLLRSATTEDALPVGEPTVAAPAPSPLQQSSVVTVEPEPVPMPVPVKNDAPAAFGNEPMVQHPSPKQQSWGAVISILIIVMMIIVGAFYAWGERIADRQQYYQTQQ